MASISSSPIWKQLQEHQKEVASLHLRNLFKTEGDTRFEKFYLNYNNEILLDFSKNLITDKTLQLLLQLPVEAKLSEFIEKMFTGDKINTTENRAVLHVALRNVSNVPILVEGKDVMPDVNSVKDKMRRFSNAVRNCDWKGYTGKK